MAANQRGGIVLGTGDLSELALGWCTYGVGDQMSHYGVNAGVPKTLMQHLIRWVVSSQQFEGPVNGTLLAILDQEISPELVPAKEGERIQSTEDSVGPYALQDFTLFHVLRRGYRPSKIAFLAEHAWSDAGSGLWPSGYPEGARPAYDLAAIRRWMRVFHEAPHRRALGDVLRLAVDLDSHFFSIAAPASIAAISARKRRAPVT